MKTFDEFIRVSNIVTDSNYDSTRFSRFIEGSGNIDGVITNTSKFSSISRFYESTNEFNQSKISELINISIDNINKVYNLVVDYEQSKQERG